MSNSLWPSFTNLPASRGMTEMLYDAAGDIGAQTNGTIDFYVDIVGVGTAGAVEDIRYNCYLRITRKSYVHLLFRVTSPVGSPFPASVATPEGESYPDLNDETELRHAIGEILRRERTKEVVLNLLKLTPSTP